MEISTLFRQYVVLGKQVTLALGSPADARRLEKALAVYKSRYLKELESLGMQELDTFEGRVIKVVPAEVDGHYRVELAASKPKPNRTTFVIISD